MLLNCKNTVEKGVIVNWKFKPKPGSQGKEKEGVASIFKRNINKTDRLMERYREILDEIGTENKKIENKKGRSKKNIIVKSPKSK